MRGQCNPLHTIWFIRMDEGSRKARTHHVIQCGARLRVRSNGTDIARKLLFPRCLVAAGARVRDACLRTDSYSPNALR